MSSSQKPKEVQSSNGRLLKWAVELSKFDITFKPRYAIRDQAFADFNAEFTRTPEAEIEMELVEPLPWNLFVDGSSGESESWAGIVLENPEGHRLSCGVKFGFEASNNVVEYEALLADLRLAKEMQVRRLHSSSDLQLVVSQVNGSFAARNSSMASYLKMILNLIPSFEKFELIHIPRLENGHADALSRLASCKDSELLRTI